MAVDVFEADSAVCITTYDEMSDKNFYKYGDDKFQNYLHNINGLTKKQKGH